MPIKISDFLPPSQFGNVLGREVVDQIGIYLKSEILYVATPLAPPAPPIYYKAKDLPYNSKVRSFLLNYAGTLPKRTVDYGADIVVEYDDKQAVIDALNDPATGLFKLVTVVENIFNITQASAMAQFNIPMTPPPPPVKGSLPPTGQPYIYIPMTFGTAIQVALGEVIPILSQAVENFITLSYQSNGLA